MPLILLILIVPLIGLIAGVISISGGSISIGGLLWVIIPLIVLFLFLGSMRGDGRSSTERTGSWTNDWADIPDATVTQLDGHTFQLDARGRSFIVTKDRHGTSAAREIDQRGRYISQPMFGSPRNVKGEDASLADLLKYKINTRT